MQPRNGSVIREPDVNLAFARPPLMNDFVMYYATAADEMPRWGVAPTERDKALRKFWYTEPYLASAVFSTAARYASYQYHVHGPAKQVARYQDMLAMSDQGGGWHRLILKHLIDEFTQDNGAFMETVRLENNDTSPVVQLNHLDAGRCYRTGLLKEPVVYYDNHDIGHVLKHYQVAEFTEMPSPEERARGLQFCTVTRMLRAAQIMRDVNQYMYEKIGGRRQRAIHLVSGVGRATIAEAIAQAQGTADQENAVRYMDPVVVAAIDPTAKVAKETIELASLPDSFNEETRFRWYIACMALAFGGDYQDFAPLPGGNLGTAQQSEVLDRKARGKGPGLFQSQITQKFNFHGIMPRTCRFSFGDAFSDETAADAQAAKTRAEERKIRIESGEITPAIARQIAVDAGDLPQDLLALFNEQDIHPDVQGHGEYPLDSE